MWGRIDGGRHTARRVTRGRRSGMEGWRNGGREGGRQGGIKTEYWPKTLRHRYVTSYGTSLIHFSPIHPGSPMVHVRGGGGTPNN